MIGVIGEPDPPEGLAKSFASALFEGLLEATELVPLACVALLCVGVVCLFGGVVYHLMFDPNAVDVASRLDALSVDPDKWFPRS